MRPDEWRQPDARCKDVCRCAKASARRDTPENASTGIGRGNSAGRTAARNIVADTADRLIAKVDLGIRSLSSPMYSVERPRVST